MPTELTAEQAAARLNPRHTPGIPPPPGPPPPLPPGRRARRGRGGPLLQRQAPRVMTTVATPPDADGWCSLSLHAGGTIDELRRAGADPDRLLVVEASEGYPRTRGLGGARPPPH